MWRKLEGGEGRDVLILVMCSLHSMTYNKIPPLRKLQCMPAGMRRKKYWEEGGVILLSRCPESREVDGHVGFPDVRTDQVHSASLSKGVNPCSHSSKLLTYSSESLESIQSGGASLGQHPGCHES